MQNILAILYGLVFGIANIIPGVSGGTMLVVFGCYDKVCGALTLNLKEIKKNIVFLIFFGIGAVAGIFGFAFVITWLFGSFPLQTNMFFMGLIIGSVPLIIRNATVKDKFRPVCLVPFIIGLAAVVALTAAQNSSSSGEPCAYSYAEKEGVSYITLTNNSGRTVSKWTLELDEGCFDGKFFTASDVSEQGAEKAYTANKLTDTLKNMIPGRDPSKHRKAVIEGSFPAGTSLTFRTYAQTASLSEDNVSLSAGYAMDAGFFAWLLIATFIAAVAMIIPGVSGSFVMVTLGTYETAIGAVKSLDIITIIPIAVGAVLGIVIGARLVTLLLKKLRLITFSVILGLVAGSLYAVFPAGFGFNIDTLAGAFALAAGAVISFIVGKKTKVDAD